MLLRLVAAELRHRPGRAIFLLSGYSLGVAVMVVLLAVGEAMLEQARDRALVGGGDLVILPAGVSPEMLKAGSVTSLFVGLDHARFLHRQVLESTRAREDLGILAASPTLEGKLVEIVAGTDTFTAVATGEIPSRAVAVGAAPRLLAGAWRDSEADRRWTSPLPHHLFEEIDRFHLPPPEASGDSTWAEWHYFNAVLDADRWIYLTFLVGGRVGVPGEWGGRVLLTIREADGSHRSLVQDSPCSVPECSDPLGTSPVSFDTAGADLRIGAVGSVRQENGVYRIVARAQGSRVELEVTPAPGRYFPPTELGGAALVSGYSAPALRARASGTVCLPQCRPVNDLPAYHDHNWGVWRGVSWEWGAASSDRLSLLYGVVRGETGSGAEAASRGMFAYLVDERGVRGLFRPSALEVTESRESLVGGDVVRVPRRMAFVDSRRGFQVEIEVHAAHVTDTGRERSRYFIQMRGEATVREAGHAPERLSGFFETYADAEGSGSVAEVRRSTSPRMRAGEQGFTR